MTVFNVDDLKMNPAAVDAVVNGIPDRAACEQHDVPLVSLNNWVKKAYPDHVGSRAREGCARGTCHKVDFVTTKSTL